MSAGSGWPEVAVGDAFSVQLGKMLSKKAKVGVSPFPYLANRNVQWMNVDISGLEWMDFTEQERQKFELRPGDLLVCEGGEVGRTALWKGEVVPCYFQKAIHRLRPTDATVEPRFMLHFMRFAAKRGLFAQLTSTTSIAHLTKVKLEQMQMPLPPVPEQRRIADILDQADAIRRKRQETLRLSQEFLRSAFLDLFGDPVTNPKGWPEHALDDVAEFRSGSTLPEGELFSGQRDGYLLLKVAELNMPENRPTIRVARAWSREGAARSVTCMPGAVVFPKRGGAISTNKKRQLARPAVLDPNLMGVEPRFGIQPSFLHQWFERFDLNRIVSGSTVPQLNKRDLAPLVIAVPPRELQERFDSLLGLARRWRRRAGGHAAQLDVLSASLSQRAFAGKL